MNVIRLLVFSLLLWAQSLDAQQFMMQAWYWDYPKAGDGFSWADTISDKAGDLQTAGFTHVWAPPHAACSFGDVSNGYDPRDLYIGPTTTGIGTRGAVDAMFGNLNGGPDFKSVVDVIYNHRDGGHPEDNPAVEGWIENMTAAKIAAGDQPFPSDRFRCALPIGGTTGRGAGDYYLKIRSASDASNFYNRPYKVYLQTNTVGWQNLPNLTESEPNSGDGAPCFASNQFNTIPLGRDMFANLDAIGCRADEFKLTLTAADFDPAGDTIFIYLTNRDVSGLGSYSDHYVYALWYQPTSGGGFSVQGDVRYQTYTNFANMPSGLGEMHWNNFKPNGNPTQLNGDLDAMYFFYDYDQDVTSTATGLREYTKWNFTDLGTGGLRMDAVKHFKADFVGGLLTWLHTQNPPINPDMVVGENFTTNVATLNGWVNLVNAAMSPSARNAIKPKIFDFSLRDNIRSVCDDGSDARNLFIGSCADNGMSGFNVVTFVNNHDFRGTSGFDALVKSDIELGYAYILLNNKLGVPCVYYPDYYGYPPVGSGYDFSYHPTDKAPRKAEIDQLIQAHKLYVNNANQHIYLNAFGTSYSSSYTAGSANKATIFQLGNPSTGKSVIVAINFGTGPLNVTHSISNIGGTVGNGTVFSDVLGRSTSPTLTVSGMQVNLQVPARNYSMWVQGNLPVIFPLDLLRFSATRRDADVLLEWTTANEKNVQQFDIQRSVDGKTFETIGTVAARNTAEAQYTWPDTRLPEAATEVYYRLEQYDTDGQSTYSPVRTVRLPEAALSVQLSPNPAVSRVWAEVESAAEVSALVEVSDLQGRVVYTAVAELRKGANQVNIPLERVASGEYSVRLTAGQWSVSRKLLVR
jgi:hypothetical protein